ncbi:hypothetical protein GPECTOR_29g125 [Gonium pectorale]|uniref:Uncharacterized protein n=1 Tax=Gonium pectorale TaxID=33097 RepID=A0A150GFW2_GONPE|nr:hypothetical protein GPECTOR_29g125 [Gonium pectorale]|eukprot:KXZ48220.1 hypothetical protein GPECTOR_29g125 [Gonium pectorale]
MLITITRFLETFSMPKCSVGGATLVFDVELVKVSDQPANPAEDPYGGEYDVTSGEGYNIDEGDQLLGGADLSGLNFDEDAGEQAEWS